MTDRIWLQPVIKHMILHVIEHITMKASELKLRKSHKDLNKKNQVPRLVPSKLLAGKGVEVSLRHHISNESDIFGVLLSLLESSEMIDNQLLSL